MSNQEDALAAILAKIAIASGAVKPLTLVRLDYTPEKGGAFVVYADNGDVFGGNGLEKVGDTDAQRQYLLDSLQDGTFANTFAVYEPVPADVLTAKMGEYQSWEVLFDGNSSH